MPEISVIPAKAGSQFVTPNPKGRTPKNAALGASNVFHFSPSRRGCPRG
jgi:hypothetical protein